MNRDSIIKGLAVFTAVALVLFIGFSIVKVLLNASQEEMKIDTAAPVTLDSNSELKATIDSLESTWQEIQASVFTVNQDPLHLGRVIADFAYAKERFKEMEEEEGMRLTATVIDASPKAIIKFHGKSYVVQVGQMVGSSRVVSIGNRQVVLESGGSRTVLENKPVKGLEESGGDSDYSNSAETETSNY